VAYAQRIQARRPAKVCELKASTRTIELIFFLRVTLLELSDALLYQTGRRVSDLVRQAYDRTTVRQARSAIECRAQLVAIKALVQDSERTAQERLKTLTLDQAVLNGASMFFERELLPRVAE